MKLLLLTLCLQLVTPLKIPPLVLSFWNDIVLPNSGECIAESKVDPTKVRDIFEVAPLPYDKNLGCFLNCAAERLHFFLPNGTFDETKFFAVLPDYEKPLLRDCIHGHNAETDSCNKVFWVFSCLLEYQQPINYSQPQPPIQPPPYYLQELPTLQKSATEDWQIVTNNKKRPRRLDKDDAHTSQSDLNENYWLSNNKFSSLADDESMETNTNNTTKAREPKLPPIFVAGVENIIP
ncbi:hypothetical protein FQA39_LY12377 [Lamprigera yunnana]|nr:hypothetical protein FQA39_LY12377 [Lamprigera yunnana]